MSTAPRVAPRSFARTGTIEFVAEHGAPSSPSGQRADGPLAPPDEPGARAVTIPGPADAWKPDFANPWPNADVDTPDERAAARGGGETGGTPSWTGRNDGDEELRAQPWNDPDTYRLERHANDRTRESPESIAREVAPDIDNAHRERDRAATDGALAPVAQPDEGDPRLDSDALRDPEGPRPGSPAPPLDSRTSQLSEDGAVVMHAGRPVAVTGVEATEAKVHGPHADFADSAQASDEPHPVPLELTRPSAGGKGGVGVAGPSTGLGNSARAPRVGTGQGGTPSDILRKPGGQASTHAAPQHAYYRKLFKRVYDHLVFPPQLAVALEQGEVVVTFTLRTDGTVADVAVSRPSGYPEFDAAAVVAVRNAAPFGKVPAAVSQGKNTLFIAAPITFRNPIIR